MFHWGVIIFYEHNKVTYDVLPLNVLIPMGARASLLNSSISYILEHDGQLNIPTTPNILDAAIALLSEENIQ